MSGAFNFVFCECPNCGYTTVMESFKESVLTANKVEGKPQTEFWCPFCSMAGPDVQMSTRPAKDDDAPGGKDHRVSFGVGKGSAQ